MGCDGTVRYVSPALKRVLGHAPEDRTNANAFEPIHPDDVARARDLLAGGSRKPGVPVSVELRMRHADGSWRDVEVIGTNLLSDPNTGAVVLNTRDVTERKEALRESEARFRAIFEQSSDALLVHDDTGRMVDCNREA